MLHWLLVEKHLLNRSSIHNVMTFVDYIYTRNIRLSVYRHDFKECVYLSKLNQMTTVVFITCKT